MHLIFGVKCPFKVSDFRKLKETRRLMLTSYKKFIVIQQILFHRNKLATDSINENKKWSKKYWT